MMKRYVHPFIANPVHYPVREIVHGVPTPPPGGWHGPTMPKWEKFPTPIWNKLPTQKLPIWHGLPTIPNPRMPTLPRLPVYNKPVSSPPPGGGNKTQSNPDDSGAMGALIGAVASVLPFLL